MNTSDYKTQDVTCAFLSDALPEDCERLIGKTVARVEAGEYSFTLVFTDESSVTVSGARWDGCCLGVGIEALR